jgi:predicted RNA-binding Zn-ribbon protein involved in translation (DUF1610 family)/uncharacterized membrane protein
MGIRLECKCGEVYEVADQHAGMKAECPACGATLDIPGGNTGRTSGETPRPASETSTTAQEQAICAVCQCAVSREEDSTQCTACGTTYHTECWEENKGCGVYGCPQVPPTEKWTSLDIPVSFWGREKKPCPSCGAEILAAARRCRQCGAEFDEVRPVTGDEFREREELKKRLPSVKKAAMWLFILNVLTCAAPVAAIIGVFWYKAHRKDLENLPSLHYALFRIGLYVGIGQTIMIIVVTLLFTVFRT